MLDLAEFNRDGKELDEHSRLCRECAAARRKEPRPPLVPMDEADARREIAKA